MFRAGETFPHDPAISEPEARALWAEQSQMVMVAIVAWGAVLGTCYLRPNSLSLGAHVANAGYVVGNTAAGKVSAAASVSIHSRQHSGFQIVGTLPGAFRYRKWATWMPL